ncbi:MAG: hypothetical protein PVG87_25450, partial [Desulfobacteraceae bacterium]
MTALDVLLDDLYRFLSELHVTPGSSVLLIRNDGTVMLPRDANQKLIVEHTENVSFVSPANIEKDLIRDAIDVWERSRTGSFAVKAFSSEGKTWWAGFKPLQPEASKTWIGVII